MIKQTKKKWKKNKGIWTGGATLIGQKGFKAILENKHQRGGIRKATRLIGGRISNRGGDGASAGVICRNEIVQD